MYISSVTLQFKAGDQITVYHGDDSPISIEIQALESPIPHHYQLHGVGVADGELYTIEMKGKHHATPQ